MFIFVGILFCFYPRTFSFTSPYPISFLFVSAIYQNARKSTDMKQTDKTSINKSILYNFFFQIYVPEKESSDDEPLITFAKQKEPVWKWRKNFAKTPLQPCSLKEEGVVNMQTENVTPFEAFSKCISLPGFFL